MARLNKVKNPRIWRGLIFNHWPGASILPLNHSYPGNQGLFRSLRMALRPVIRLPFWLLALALLAPLPAMAQSEDLSDKRILLLYSYHPGFPTSDKILAGLQQAFGDYPPQLDIEYMDSKRHQDAASLENLLQLLSHKLRKRQRYDLIITADDNALDFIRQHRSRLAANTPVVFLGVNDPRKAQDMNNVPWATGVFESLSFPRMLTLAEQLMPGRRNVYVIADSRKTSQTDLHTLQQQMADFTGLNFRVLSLTQLSWDDLRLQLQNLGDQDLVLLIGAYSDRFGHEFSFYDSLKLIREATPVPILHPYEHGIGQGVLGGVVVSHTEQGRQAGRMARKILAGEDIRLIPVMNKSPNLPMADDQELQRLGIDRTLLPADTRIINQSTSVWHTYQTEIISASLIFALLFLLAIYLASQNIRMRLLTDKVEEKSSYLRLLMETLPDLVWIKNPDGVYLTCNKRFEQFFGASEQHITGKTDYDFVDQDLADFFRQHDMAAMQARGLTVNEEHITFASDGHSELLETIKTPVYDHKTGRLLGVLGVGRNITQRKANENMLRLSASVVENTIEAIMIIDADGKIVQVNRSFCDITGYSRDDVLGKTPDFLRSDGYDDDFYQQVDQALLEQGRWSGEYINRHKDGSLCPVWQTISTVKDDQDQIRNYVSVFSDISQIKQSQQEVFHLAYHDTLTNLPNRLLLRERLDQAIKHAQRNDKSFTLMFVDLDNFKNINDSQGHPEGDRLLKNVADFLKQTLREKDTVARVGGDEFVLLFDDLGEAEAAARLAQKILDTLDQPIALASGNVRVSASVGLCLFPQDGDNADDLLRNADAAMYRAKSQGRNNYQFYTETMTRDIIERVNIENELRHAICRNELSLHYQPQIDLTSGQAIGVEALLRWHNEKLGQVPPDRFIAIAEDAGLMLTIGEWVLNQAGKQARDWLDRDIPFGRIAVNIAGPQITKMNLVEQVSAMLHHCRLPATRLSLEVTETFIMQNQDSSVKQLYLLHEMGVELAIDDFGTGYSSLSYLKKLPISKLKIDKSFIRDMPEDSDDIAISNTIVALANSLGLDVIAEGVETREQAQLLLQAGCQQAQGFLYSRPLTVPQLEQYFSASPQQSIAR